MCITCRACYDLAAEGCANGTCSEFHCASKLCPVHSNVCTAKLCDNNRAARCSTKRCRTCCLKSKKACAFHSEEIPTPTPRTKSTKSQQKPAQKAPGKSLPDQPQTATTPKHKKDRPELQAPVPSAASRKPRPEKTQKLISTPTSTWTVQF